MQKLKTFLVGCALVLWGAWLATSQAWANPQEELTSDQPLYQRVKALEQYGLLDPQDQAVLDAGKIVTRLELAFYTEKAKARLAAPPVIEASPTPQPSPVTAPPPPIAPPIAPPLQPVTPAVSAEVDKLLKEFKEEVAALRMRLVEDDERLKEKQKELDALGPIQDQINDIFKNANKQTGSTYINSVSRFHFEDINFVGDSGTPAGLGSPPYPVPPNSGSVFIKGSLPSANALRTSEENAVQMATDLGGHGSFFLGLDGALSDSNVSANGLEGTGPVSLYVFSPDFSLLLNGPLGDWNTHAMVEGYPGALTLGDFCRGVGPIFVERFEDPFDIKHYTDDKDMKIWDDYMSNVSAPAPNPASGVIASTYDQVFDGIYGVGNNLPLLGGDARLVLLVGRMGISNVQPDRWEEGAKLDGALTDFLRADLAAEWVNDHDADPGGPEMDMQGYQNEYFLNFNPVTISLEGGLSSLYTGFTTPVGPTPSTGITFIPDNNALIGYAAQGSLSFYPLTLYYFGIDPDYSNFQSKVALAGVNFARYGEAFSPSQYEDVYGWVGEVDSLVSDRYGYRLNLGWNGRQQDWMKSWPSFLDNLVVNFDYSQKHEYVAEYTPGTGSSPGGYNVIEVLNETSLYYGDDEGLWGLDFWGGYGPGGVQNPWYTTRQAYIDNVEADRNDGDFSDDDDVRYKSNMSSERIPFIIPGIPVTLANGSVSVAPLAPGSQPATFNNPADPSYGLNAYYVLPDLKTYNYITVTTKYQFNKLWGSTTPLYGSFYFTDNTVSGQSNSPSTPSIYQNIPNLFNQTVCDVAGMYQLFRNVNVMIDRSWETWNCNYTYPLVNYRYDSFGLGFAYDFPWGGGKWEFRYKHFTFKDEYVPQNDYTADQFFSTMSFLF